MIEASPHSAGDFVGTCVSIVSATLFVKMPLLSSRQISTISAHIMPSLTWFRQRVTTLDSEASFSYSLLSKHPHARVIISDMTRVEHFFILSRRTSATTGPPSRRRVGIRWVPGSAPIHVQAHAPHRPQKLQQTVPKIEVIAATWLGRMMFALIIPRLSKAITIHGGKACCVRHGLTIISNGPIRQPRRVQ